ncbi:MAG TPA: HlyC/CorC family transporter, partial [Gammaproteobacteria bacterium]|nr:HlyC/CorC family transporter [Gammaproteobacteria bacterium]
LLIVALLVMVFFSGFFGASETAMMTLNRYRLRHLAKAKHPGAVRAQKLLERPDQLIGLLMLWINFMNSLASGLATFVALKLFGDSGIAIATGIMTFLLLVFTDIAPKTLAALHPERVAFPAAFVLTPLLWISRPLVHIVNGLANAVLRLFGVRAEEAAVHSLSAEELRTVVNEAGALLPRRHKRMLLSILDLEKATVEDIMVPRNEIVGIDLDEDIEQITDLITHTQYTRLPVFENSIDNVVGIVHLRNVVPLLKRGALTHEELRSIAREPYFIPEGTSLNRQLLNFQRESQRTGLVVDEYGDIQGLVALEDILEEIVGEFTTDPAAVNKDITLQEDGSYLIDCAAYIRDLNRALQTELPTDGPKTLNGLILEHMEDIPEAGTSLLLAGYPIEIVQTKDNAVKIARIHPKKRRPQSGQ